MPRTCSHCQHHFSDTQYVCPNCGSECFENAALVDALNLTDSSSRLPLPRILISLVIVIGLAMIVKWILL